MIQIHRIEIAANHGRHDHDQQLNAQPTRRTIHRTRPVRRWPAGAALVLSGVLRRELISEVDGAQERGLPDESCQ